MVVGDLNFGGVRFLIWEDDGCRDSKMGELYEVGFPMKGDS